MPLAFMTSGIQGRAHDPTGAADLVADDASLLGKEPPADLLVPAGIEIVEREKERDEVAGVPRVELGPRDAELRHPLRHPRGVIPHRRGEIVEGPRPRDATQIRADLATGAAHGVALDAAPGAEDARARDGILRRTEERLGE